MSLDRIQGRARRLVLPYAVFLWVSLLGPTDARSNSDVPVGAIEVTGMATPPGFAIPNPPGCPFTSTGPRCFAYPIELGTGAGVHVPLVLPPDTSSIPSSSRNLTAIGIGMSGMALTSFNTADIFFAAADMLASDLNSVITSMRGYYANNVVSRVLVSPGSTQVVHNYETIPGAIPIPATLSLELGRQRRR